MMNNPKDQILKLNLPEGSYLAEHKLLSPTKWLLVYIIPSGVLQPVIIDLDSFTVTMIVS